MTDKRMYKLLTDFANDNALAKDNAVKVEISDYCHSYTAINKDSPARYEDINLLVDLVRGAKHFLYWARRKKIL